MPKLHGRKAGAKSTPSKVIKYVLNEKKTLAYDTIGLTEDRPYSQQFREVATMQGSDYGYDERKYYHFKMTFDEQDWDKNGGTITTEKALKMAREFCEKNFPGHDAVLSVHGDTDNLHVHIVLNAFSSEYEQNKIHLTEEEYAGLKDWAYDIGKEYDLTEKHWRVETVEKRDRERREKENQQNTDPINLSDGEIKILNKLEKKDRAKDFGSHSWKEQYRIAIDEAKRETTNLDSFRDYLKENFHIDTKVTKHGNIKYKMPERTSYSSGEALGTDYELPAVERALEETRNKPSDLPKEPTKEQLHALEWRIKFDEEYARLKEWEKTEFEKQREEWLKAERERNLAEKEEYRNKTVLEHTASIYQMCQQAQQDEILSSAITEKERAELAELEKQHKALANQEQYSHINSLEASFSDYEIIREVQDEKRQSYISTLQTTGTSLADRIAAAQNLQEMNVEEGRKKDLLTQAQEDYGKDTRRHQINTHYNDMRDAIQRAANSRGKVYLYDENGRKRSTAELVGILMEVNKNNREGAHQNHQEEQTTQPKRRTIYAKKDWKAQNLYNAGRVAQELGANNQVELELKVKQEGREYGKIKKEYNAAKKTFKENVDKAAEEIFNKESTLTIEEQVKKFDEVVSAEREKLQPIEDKFLEAKEHYKKCIRALETVNSEQSRQTLYATPEQHQEEQKEEAPRRSKAEAQRETDKQWAQMRDWSDEAVKAVADKPYKGKEADLKEWAKEMEKHGCQVRITANTVSVTHPESNQAVRTNRLGGAYEKEAIENSISLQRNIAIERDNRSQSPTRQIVKDIRDDDYR